MPEPTGHIDGLIGYIFTLLQQFAGGPGPLENNLMRFGLPAILWASLMLLALGRRRSGDYPRERWLVWGFGAGFLRELFMFVHISLRLLNPSINQTLPFLIMEPLEHALSLVAMTVVAGAFMRYVLEDDRLARRFMAASVVLAIISSGVVAPWWLRQMRLTPDLRFHQTWGAWVFHVTAVVLITIAIGKLMRRRSWLRDVVAVALLFFYLGEGFLLVNFATGRRYAEYICPIGNAFHMLAIPLLGYVYLREQAIEKRLAEAQLDAYRGHLEELVEARTEEITATNRKLVQEIVDRQKAEAALARLGRHHELILNSAGEGIFGVNVDGRHTFVNRAAADMLGYQPIDLIGKPSHPIWHHSYADGSPYPESDCPLHNGYKTGRVRRGSDQVFWRKDGTSFPVRYVSTPIFENGDLRGAVVIFQDISERKRAEAEITRRTAELSIQNTIAATISQSLDLQLILNTALETVLGELGVEAGCIYLADADGFAPSPDVFRGKDAEAWSDHGWRQSACRAASRDAASTQMPVTMVVAEEDECGEPDCLGEPEDHALVSIPLVSKNRAVGAMTLATQEPGALADDIPLLTTVGRQIGVAVENARLHQETQRSAEQLASLHQASVSLNTSLDLKDIYDSIAEEAMHLLECQAAAVYIWQELDREAERVLVRGLPEVGGPDVLDVHDRGNSAPESVVPVRLSAQERRHLNDLIQAREPLIVPDTALDSRLEAHWAEEIGLKAVLGLPLWGTDRPFGFLLVIDRKSVRHWRPDELELAESFANLGAMVLEKAHLYRQAERAAALEERQRLAADMHDGLAQTLSYLGHQIDVLTELAGDHKGDEVIAAGHRMRGIIDGASREVRRFIASLHVRPRPPRSLQALIRDTLATTSTSKPPVTHFETDLEELLYVSQDAGEQITRIVKEAVLNAQNHASAQAIVVSLHVENGRGCVSVADKGEGFDPTRLADDGRGHFGLSIMRARADRLSGHLEIRSAPGEGTEVILHWPIGAAEKRQDLTPEPES